MSEIVMIKIDFDYDYQNNFSLVIKTLKYLIPDRRPACGTRTEYHESSQDGGDVGKTKRDHQGSVLRADHVKGSVLRAENIKGSVLRTDHVKGSVLISEKKQHP